MTKEITKNLYCVLIRGEVEIWVDEDKATKMQDYLQTIKESKFVRFENQTINTADVIGVFKAEAMEDRTKRKNGYWKCDFGYWHARGETCAHKDLEKYNRSSLKTIRV